MEPQTDPSVERCVHPEHGPTTLDVDASSRSHVLTVAMQEDAVPVKVRPKSRMVSVLLGWQLAALQMSRYLKLRLHPLGLKRASEQMDEHSSARLYICMQTYVYAHYVNIYIYAHIKICIKVCIHTIIHTPNSINACNLHPP